MQTTVTDKELHKIAFAISRNVVFLFSFLKRKVNNLLIKNKKIKTNPPDKCFTKFWQEIVLL